MHSMEYQPDLCTEYFPPKGHPPSFLCFSIQQPLERILVNVHPGHAREPAFGTLKLTNALNPFGGVSQRSPSNNLGVVLGPLEQADQRLVLDPRRLARRT